jgi:hypothetical protein
LLFPELRKTKVKSFVQEDLAVALGRKSGIHFNESFGRGTLAPSLLFSETSFDDLKL